jgi:4-diphosphocytidyl-2-C-methyl-D-erythritol kinase
MSSGTPNSISRKAHAKVNLALAVAPVDPESKMHRIESWMHAIKLGDEITIERAEDESSYRICTASGEQASWALADDLAVRAHIALESRIERTLPINLSVIKHTPSGGGLGGGSSDAASVLMMLNELFDLRLGELELREIASTLGSDVHFFVDPESFRMDRAPRAAKVSGFGEIVERVDRRSMPITLLVPSFGCATSDVYRAFDRAERSPIELGVIDELIRAGLDREPALFNDLAAPAMDVEPALGALYQSISDGLGRMVHVSGSGSTMFVLGRVDHAEIARIAPSVAVIDSELV